tara:strand:- start:373 stop:612 length:240 start_codon:yes stop_codon:yes gene_type:complete
MSDKLIICTNCNCVTEIEDLVSHGFGESAFDMTCGCVMTCKRDKEAEFVRVAPAPTTAPTPRLDPELFKNLLKLLDADK